MRKGRTLKSQQRWADKKLYPWIIASLVVSVVQHWSSLDLIGEGAQYQLWVTWVPLLTGVMVLGILRWDYLTLRAADMEGFGWKLILWGFMLIQGLMFSYTSFGLLARTTADLLNRSATRDEAIRIERYPVREAYMRRRSRDARLRFNRDGRSESVKPGYIKELRDQRWDPPIDIILRTQPGILGTTIVLDYSLEWVERGHPRAEDPPSW